MAWKNIKDHYRIGHIVQIRDGLIGIGSSYVFDLIRVTFDGKVSWGNLGASSNDDLARYYAEMTADLGKVKELIDSPDTFTTSLPVWTYDESEIQEKQCEAYGYPNITHDGQLMYVNSFSAERDEVVKWAKRNAACSVKSYKRLVKEAEARLAETQQWLTEAQTHHAKLETDWPHIDYEKPTEE